MKEIQHSKKPNPAKRKRIANIPLLGDEKHSAGRPTKHQTLTKITNDTLNPNEITSKELILRCLDGSEKKKKIILTSSQENIELFNAKQFACFEFLADLRQKALDTIKEQKDILEKLLYMEKQLIQNVEERKNKKPK